MNSVPPWHGPLPRARPPRPTTPNAGPLKRAVPLVLAALTLALGGCPAPQKVTTLDFRPGPGDPDAALPTYGELVERYNANASAIDRLFCFTWVEARWREDDGGVRRESGDGILAFERPLNTAVSVSAYGQEVLWAGSNAAEYWLFTDLHRDGELYFGRHANLGRTPRTLPMPVPPDALPFLMGLVPIDPSRVPPPPAVERLDGYWLIEPPGLSVRMLLDPRNARPVRIDLLDAQGRSAVIARLEGTMPVRMPRVQVRLEGQPDDAAEPVAAEVPEKIMVAPPDLSSSMTIQLQSANADPSRLRGRFYDLGQLREKFDPEKVNDLDAE